MSKVTVTLTEEQMDEIFAHELVRDHKHLIEWHRQRHFGEGMSYEHHDPEEDAKALDELIRAFERVMEYYGAGKQ